MIPTLTDLKLILPEIIILFTGSLILINGVTTRSYTLTHILAITGAILALLLKLILLFVFSYKDTSFPFIFSGTLVANKLESIFSIIFLISLISCLNLIKLYKNKITDYKSEFYGMLFYSTAGMMLLARSNEMITAYVALELTTLPLVGLVSLGKSYLSKESAIKYLILSAVSTSFFLLGVVYIYALTGTTFISSATDIPINIHYGNIFQGLSYSQLNMPNDIYTPLNSLNISNIIIIISMIFVFIGLLFKLGVFPFHSWIPDVYEGAPTPITMFLSVASKSAGLAILLRILLSIFDLNDVSNTQWNSVLKWPDISMSLAIMSVLTMFTGNLLAIRQTNIKRMLAYSSIAQAGYILIGIVAIINSNVSSEAIYVSSVLLAYIFGYMFTNISAFYSIAFLMKNSDSYEFNNFVGYGRIDIWNSLFLSISMLSLIGIPPTIGFITKLFLFSSGVSSGYSWLIIFALINSVISAYYYLKVVKNLYFVSNELEIEKITFNSKPPVFGLFLIIIVIVFGFYPDPIYDFCYDAIQSVIN